MTVNPLVCSMMVEAMAVQARIEAMKVENEYRIRRGEVIAYGEEAFLAEAATLNGIAASLRIVQ